MWIGSCKIISLSSHQTPRHPPISQRSLGGVDLHRCPEHFSIRQKTSFSPHHFIYIYVHTYRHTYSSGIPRWNGGDVIIPSQKMLGKQNGKTVAVANCRFGGFSRFHHLNQGPILAAKIQETWLLVLALRWRIGLPVKKVAGRSVQLL